MPQSRRRTQRDKGYVRPQREFDGDRNFKITRTRREKELEQEERDLKEELKELGT